MQHPTLRKHMEQLKHNTLLDIYTILFCTRLSAPDMYEHLCKAYIQKAGVPFSDIVNKDGNSTRDEERNFYKAISTEASPSFTQFCYKYERFFNWELFSIKQDCDKVFTGVQNAVDKLKPVKKVRLEDIVGTAFYIECTSMHDMLSVITVLSRFGVDFVDTMKGRNYLGIYVVASYGSMSCTALNNSWNVDAPRYKSSDLILPVSCNS